MTTLPIPRRYPPPAKWKDRIRNGKVPDWRTPSLVAARSNFVLAHCRKLLFSKTVIAGENTPAGVAGTSTPWRWHCGLGETTNSADEIYIHVEALMLPADNASATDPRFVVNIGGSASTDPGRFGLIDTGGVDYANLSEVTTDYSGSALSPGTQYECSVDVIDYARLVSLSVWEVQSGGIDVSSSYVIDPRLYAVGNDITDAQHQQLIQHTHAIWKTMGTQYFALCPDVVANAWTRTTNSYVNVLDDSSTSVTADTPGYTLVPTYHNPYHTDNVPCVFAVYGSLSGAGTGDVDLVDSTGSIATVQVNSATPAWYTTTCSLDGSGSHKVDVHFQGDGSVTLTLNAVSLYAWGDGT